MQTQQGNNQEIPRRYLTAEDHLTLYAHSGKKVPFEDWLMNAYHQGTIGNDEHGNFLTH